MATLCRFDSVGVRERALYNETEGRRYAEYAEAYLRQDSRQGAIVADIIQSPLIFFVPSIFWSGMSAVSSVGKVLAGAGSLAKGAAVAVVGSHAAIPVALVVATATSGKMLYDHIYPGETEKPPE